MILVDLFIKYAFEILTVLWIFASARSILFWINFIQIKQYRLDRLWLELKSTSFYRLFFSSYRSVLIGFYLTWQLLLRTSVSSQFGAFDYLLMTIILFFLYYVVDTIRHLKQQRLQLPTFTVKVWGLFILLLSCELFVVSLYQFWPEQLLVIEILQPVIVLLVFAVLFIPNSFVQLQMMKRAREKRQALTKVKVIGITGSYGKTSMKEMTAHLLEQKFSVLKTPKHINVDTGVANLVLEKLTDEYDFFIVEMGAYRKGEIGRISHIVQPNYAIMTGLSNQHLELFGSIEAIAEAKFELVNAVNNPSNVIANFDSRPLRAEFNKRKMKPIYYGFDHEANYAGIDYTPTETGGTFSLSETKIDFPLFGKSHATNVLGAISICKQLGMSIKEINDALKTLPQIERTMEVKKGINGSLIIDDTYNANTQGILYAMDDLEALGKKKTVFVFKELIELGEETTTDYESIMQAVSSVCSHVLLLPGEHRQQLRSLLIQNGFNAQDILHMNSPETLKSLLDKDAVVLFEGRGAETLLQSIVL